MTGSLSILNVGVGDTKLTFDNSDPDEVARSGAIVTDMLRRGFAILIEVGRDDQGPLYRRCKAFDPETCEYIIAGTVGDQEGSNDEETKAPQKTRKPNAAKTTGPSRNRKAAGTTRIPAAAAKGVAVARTAGG